MQYRILTNDHPVRLANAVNKAIREGWKPQGGVSAAVDQSYYGKKLTFYQAMVAEDD